MKESMNWKVTSTNLILMLKKKWIMCKRRKNANLELSKIRLMP